MIDSHCHLDLDAFEQDRDAVIAAAQAVGVKRFHIPGTTPARWQELLRFGRSPHIDISLGLHPYFLPQDEAVLDAQLSELEQLVTAHHSNLYGIGECGLDGVISVPLAMQNKAFDVQIRLAKQFTKPLIVHARKTHPLIIQRLNQNHFTGRGIIHAFSGNLSLAKAYLDRDWLLGIGGSITYERGAKTRDTIKAIGLQHIVLETDSPDMPLFGFQGQRNTPKQLCLVAQKVAEIVGCSVEQVIESTTQHYLTLTQ